MAEEKKLDRREFVKCSCAAGAGLLLATPMGALATGAPRENIKSRGYAAIDTSGKLVPWSFERRAVGDHDGLTMETVNISYSVGGVNGRDQRSELLIRNWG